MPPEKKPPIFVFSSYLRAFGLSKKNFYAIVFNLPKIEEKKKKLAWMLRSRNQLFSFF